MIFNHTNMIDEPPKKGDILVIETKKTKPKKILVKVDCVQLSEGYMEVCLVGGQYFIFDIYERGESWVWRVWNLGEIQLTNSVNNFNRLADF
jgi:hypothetical protein